MIASIAFWPEEASTTAAQMDLAFFILLGVCSAVGLLVAFLLVWFSIRYRRRPGETGNPPETHPSHLLEWFWTLTPLAIFVVFFLIGARVYFGAFYAPPDATPVYVIGKQWMWKFQHPEGQREINELHVPLGRPVKLVMTSEDVIHSLFIPAFRIHMDLLPNRYSSLSSHYNVALAMTGVVIAGFSSLLTGLNFIVTTHWLRAPGMTWFRLPIFVWTMYATSFIFLLAVPVLAMALILVIIERVLQVGIFDPALGGDPLLFQHLFWFYSHPAVYIMILPGMGIVSEIIPCFARKQLYGYGFVAAASFGIAALGFLVWAHHMFVAGISLYAALVFSSLSFLVAVPSAIKVFNWTATLYKGSITFESPMLYALGFVGLFTFGGLAGLFLATLGVDMHVHDTYFVVSHFHFIMVGGMVTGYMAGLHYWWPKITGRMYSEWLSKLSAMILLIGFFLTFTPQYILGINGMPRRYHVYAPEFQVWNVLSTAGSSILGVGYILPLFYLLHSLRWGKPAGPNPWHATGLEWQTPSPPPRENFDRTPMVFQAPYQYHLQKAQHEP